MSTYPLWTERLFLFLDEWLYLALVLFLFMKWEYHAFTTGAPTHIGVFPLLRRERMWFNAFRVVLIVGAIFVYAVGYLSFFHRCFTER